MTPFLTFFTPTYRRPSLLARCMASVEAQTGREHVEHLIVPDYVGRGIVESLYRWPLYYAPACHGRYVHLLADDDELASPHVVTLVRQFTIQRGFPDIVLVNAVKALNGGLRLPVQWAGVPVEGRIDLGCFIVRRDIWVQHLRDYGQRYEGDFDFAMALNKAGRRFERLDLDFVKGLVMRGAAE